MYIRIHVRVYVDVVDIHIYKGKFKCFALFGAYTRGRLELARTERVGPQSASRQLRPAAPWFVLVSILIAHMEAHTYTCKRPMSAQLGICCCRRVHTAWPRVSLRVMGSGSAVGKSRAGSTEHTAYTDIHGHMEIVKRGTPGSHPGGPRM